MNDTRTKGGAIESATAQNNRLRDERDQARDIAFEAWDWLTTALDAGGWKTVFDIPDWKERGARLAADPEFNGRGGHLTKLNEERVPLYIEALS